MSTANKLTYLNQTKQKLKQAINNIGGEVTDETTFRNYVAELENAYDRLPKTEFEEGESVTLENTLKGKLDFEDGVVGIGQTEQDGTPTPSTPITINSVTGNQDVVVKDGNNNTIATYQLSLGDIELNAIGNYKDYIWTDRSTKKWYKHSKLIKLQLTSDLDWGGLFVSQINLYRVDTNAFADIIEHQSSSSQFGLCNRYINSWNDTLVNLSAGHFAVFTNGKIYITTQFTTNNMQGWKDFLDNNEVYVIVPLATATDTEITDTTLITQLEAWYNAHSNNGTTIITSNGNLPMIIKVRALKGE